MTRRGWNSTTSNTSIPFPPVTGSRLIMHFSYIYDRTIHSSHTQLIRRLFTFVLRIFNWFKPSNFEYNYMNSVLSLFLMYICISKIENTWTKRTYRDSQTHIYWQKNGTNHHKDSTFYKMVNLRFEFFIFYHRQEVIIRIFDLRQYIYIPTRFEVESERMRKCHKYLCLLFIFLQNHYVR